jgi:hypothetical protein
MHCEDTPRSPVPKGEGPGAPSSQLGTIIGTGATRRSVYGIAFPGLKAETWGTRFVLDLLLCDLSHPRGFRKPS